MYFQGCAASDLIWYNGVQIMDVRCSPHKIHDKPAWFHDKSVCTLCMSSTSVLAKCLFDQFIRGVCQSSNDISNSQTEWQQFPHILMEMLRMMFYRIVVCFASDIDEMVVGSISPNVINYFPNCVCHR